MFAVCMILCVKFNVQGASIALVKKYFLQSTICPNFRPDFSYVSAFVSSFFI